MILTNRSGPTLAAAACALAACFPPLRPAQAVPASFGGQAANGGGAARSSPRTVHSPGSFLEVPRGAGEVPLRIPRDERLEFNVHLNLGIVGEPTVGTVTITSRVEPYRPSLVVRGAAPAPAGGEVARVTMRALGSYAVYELDETISTSLLPQAFPSILHTSLQSGTENRRRELMLGAKEGAFTAVFRSDRHCKGCASRAHFLEAAWIWEDEHHCGGCKRAEHRVWRDPREKAVPEGALDMVSAVMLARSMIQGGERELSFTLVDKLELWLVRMRRGAQKAIAVDGGTFDAVELLLETRPPEGERSKRGEDFEGLFGIHGTISIWFHRATGVPVLIRGDLPVGGVMDLDVRVELARWRGTAPLFGPLKRN